MENRVKPCRRCGIEKPLTEFYKHSEMADGHLNICKTCKKEEQKLRESNNRKNPNFVESEKIRQREKYYRLNYREKLKPNPEAKIKTMRKYYAKYPEKLAAKNFSQHIPREKDHLHHWSYNEEHYTDVIHLTIEEHATLHRYIIYDQERMMYRISSTGELLDTKEKHLEFFNSINVYH